MRAVALSVSVFALAACGGEGDVTVPTEAPAGVGELPGQVFTICATAMNAGKVATAIPVAKKLGWQVEETASGKKGPIGPVDILRQTGIRKTKTDERIQFYEHDGANATSMSCTYINAFSEDAIELNLSDLDGMPGFKGRWASVEDGTMGHWSKRDENTVLSIQAIRSGDRFATLSMNKITLK